MSTTDTWIETTLGPPTEQPDAWVTVPYRFGGHEIWLARPRDPDRLLDDPAVQRASRANDYMPYWAFLWPGAVLLAERILRGSWPAGAAAVEIGCGLGLAGLAALRAGLRVTFSDYSPAALALAAHNARLNGFDQFETRIIDWQDPPRASFDIVLGADVLYERRCLPDVLRVLDAMLAASGMALLSDAGRGVADAFPERAGEHGYSVVCETITRGESPDANTAGRVFCVRRRAPELGGRCDGPSSGR